MEQTTVTNPNSLNLAPNKKILYHLLKVYLEEVTIHDPRVKEDWIGVIRGQRKVDTLIMDLNDG